MLVSEVKEAGQLVPPFLHHVKSARRIKREHISRYNTRKIHVNQKLIRNWSNMKIKIVNYILIIILLFPPGGSIASILK